MRTLILSILLLAGFNALGAASIKYYSDYPNVTNPPTTYVVSLETGDHSSGGTPYNFWTLGQMVAWLQLRGFTNGSGTIINIVTNNVFVNTNTIIATSNAFFNNTYVTNLTVVVPGGVTNLNATPKTLAWWDINDSLASIPNAAGFLSQSGSGDIGWSNTLSLTELDAQNAYLTNTFLIGLTNQLLSTDGNGQATNAVIGAGLTFSGNTLSATGTNTVGNYSSLTATNFYGLTNWLDSMTVTNGITNLSLSASQFVATDANKRLVSTLNGTTLTSVPTAVTNEVTRQINSPTNIYTGSGIGLTNLGYSLPTNNIGGGAFVFGGPGTAAALYDTNITAATTLKLFDITACGATAGGIKLYVTCSGGTDRILTFPAGCSGAGLGTPPAVTITNAKAAFFDVIYKPGATPVTNVFWSPVY